MVDNKSVKLVPILFADLPKYVYRPEYAILKDKSAEEVIQFAKRHRKVFVFVFATKSVDECPDYSLLAPPDDPDLVFDPDLDHVVQPQYIGHFVDPEDAIQQIVKASLAEDFENAILVTE
jgi:hypothetical protein